MEFVYTVGDRKITDDIDVEACKVTRTVSYDDRHSKSTTFSLTPELLSNDDDLRERYALALAKQPTPKAGAIATKPSLVRRHREAPMFPWSCPSTGWQGTRNPCLTEDQQHVNELARSLTSLYGFVYKAEARITELEKRLLLVEKELGQLKEKSLKLMGE